MQREKRGMEGGLRGEGRKRFEGHRHCVLRQGGEWCVFLDHESGGLR